MARHSRVKKEEARRLFLTNEVTSVAEIARRLRVKPHTVARWKKEENWDALRLQVERRAAEKMVEEIATERVALNAQHHKYWNSVLGKLFETVQKKGLGSEDLRSIERMASVVEKAQRGQRLARGLSLDGQTEEQIRAETEADLRTLIDMFISIVKEKVIDEEIRDAIAVAVLSRLPKPIEDGEQPAV